MGSSVVASGEGAFWLTRFKPGWNRDARAHAWPEFQCDGLVVSVNKEPDPPRLLFRVTGLGPDPIDLVGACPDLIEGPIAVPGVEVRLRWGDGLLSLWLNGQPAAQVRLLSA